MHTRYSLFKKICKVVKISYVKYFPSLLNNQEKMSILSKFAHEFVVKHYTYEHSYAILKRAYDSLLIKA